MDDFLASRPTLTAPRNGQIASEKSSVSPSSPLGDLKAEVRNSKGETATGDAPEVETVVVDGRIKRIHIHCKCGEEIILHCNYPQP
jgi:hypothetical protein